MSDGAESPYVEKSEGSGRARDPSVRFDFDTSDGVATGLGLPCTNHTII
jgi:hypothetical protein